MARFIKLCLYLLVVGLFLASSNSAWAQSRSAKMKLNWLTSVKGSQTSLPSGVSFGETQLNLKIENQNFRVSVSTGYLGTPPHIWITVDGRQSMGLIQLLHSPTDFSGDKRVSNEDLESLSLNGVPVWVDWHQGRVASVSIGKYLLNFKDHEQLTLESLRVTE